jgi:hypothetical protein
MKVVIKNLSLALMLSGALFLTSCANESSSENGDTAEDSQVENNDESQNELATREADAQMNQVNKDDGAMTEDNTVTTEITFAESSFDFGSIAKGEKVEHTYSFTNTGSEPLIITNAKASCGCTVPDWPKEPIAPGEGGDIPVVFSGKATGNQNKTITITANTNPPKTRLTIKGNVTEAES